MKIQKIILKNFDAVKLAMKANKIEIDFTTAKNKICLIVGPNGSGKTTLLSMIHPFATIGNLDVRDSSNLIIDGKDGYKEIHINDNANDYIIKHFYSPHEGKSHSVKSYIMKNGIELNENGNVTSFKEYVKEELGIEMDYLKLIRLGSNVTSLIDLSETERKNFMSKLLDDIGVFLTYYKKINDDLRQLKEMISHNMDKLNRLGITDKNEVKNLVNLLNIQKEELQKEYGEISGQISVYKHEIEQIEDPVMLKDNLHNAKIKLDKMNRILSNKNELESVDPLYYADKIQEITKGITNDTSELNASNILIKNYLSQLDDYQNTYHTIDVQYQKELNSDNELKKMKKESDNIEEQINSKKNILEGYEPNYTKKEVEDFIVFLKNKQQILDRTYEFGKEPIQKITELLKDHRNVTNYINTHLMDLTDDDSNPDVIMHRILTKYNFDNQHVFDGCNNTNCNAKVLWNEMCNIAVNVREEKKEKKDISYYKDMESAYRNIYDVMLSFAQYKDLITNFSDTIKDQFEVNRMYDKISNGENIFDAKLMNDLLSVITEYELMTSLIENKEKVDKNITMISRLSNFDSISEQVESLKEKIETTKDKIISLKDNCHVLDERIKENTNTLATLTDLKETFEKYDVIVNNANDLQRDFDLYKQNRINIQQAEIDLARCKAKEDSVTEQIQLKLNNLNQYKILFKELNTFNESYDDMIYIKESLSSKKGMPLHYIKDYLGNTEEITNELLNIAYNGQIYIDEFNITPTEFSIPFFNKGKKIRDVKLASQGEISFLSVALAFGLSTKKLSKYNIMLLDEIDGALDTRNREKFIQILENQSERISAEQLFLITHNNMFSSYPVDIVDLSFDGTHDTTYDMANYIKVTRS